MCNKIKQSVDVQYTVNRGLEKMIGSTVSPRIQRADLALVYSFTGPAGSVVEHPLRDREVVGSNPGRAIPKALKMVPVATLLGAQHYKASTGFSSPNKISHNK